MMDKTATFVRPAQQRGAMMLTAVLLLLILVTLVTLSTGRVKSFEHKIVLNAQNYQLAFSSAEAGLARAISRLTEDPGWDGSEITGTLPGQGSYSVQGVRQTITRQSTVLQLVTLTAQGSSPDSLSNVDQQQQVIQYSVLANPPDVPLIVAGGLGVSGNFEVVANPNGGGEGVPLSIWTDKPVNMQSGSGTTCGLQEFSEGNCSTSPYSEKGFKDLDILDDDVNFPPDMMEYLFNIPEAEWPTLRADADLRLTGCSSLGPSSTGLLWVDGNCTINSNTIIGSPDDPVVLVIADGNLKMNGGAQINGMVFPFRKPTTVADFDIDMVGSARVNGVVASNHPVGNSGGTYNSVYDAEVLQGLRLSDAFQRVAIVPGSWRDF